MLYHSHYSQRSPLHHPQSSKYASPASPERDDGEPLPGSSAQEQKASPTQFQHLQRIAPVLTNKKAISQPQRPLNASLRARKKTSGARPTAHVQPGTGQTVAQPRNCFFARCVALRRRPAPLSLRRPTLSPAPWPLAPPPFKRPTPRYFASHPHPCERPPLCERQGMAGAQRDGRAARRCRRGSSLIACAAVANDGAAHAFRTQAQKSIDLALSQHASPAGWPTKRRARGD